MAEETQTRAFRRDGAGHPIPGGRIVKVENITISAAFWTRIALDPQEHAKAVLMKTRDSSDFKVSHLDDGAKFFTATGMLGFDIAARPDNVIVYAQASPASVVLEILYTD